jgi:hypothetical protein
MRRIGVIADMHGGSPFSVAPPEWETEWGNVILSNQAQDKLYEYFTHFCDNHLKGCDTLLLMGDMAEGNNKKEFGRNLTAADLTEQVNMTVYLLKPYVEKYNLKVLGVNGSKYHNSLEVSLDRRVVEDLGGTYLGNMKIVHFEGTDIHAHICHSSGGSLIYRATVADRESLFLDAAEGLKKVPNHVNLLIRAHWHWYHLQENASRKAVYSPCWKVLFDWSKTGGMWSRFLSDIGGLVIELEGDNVEIYKYLYPHIQLLDKVMVV